MITCIYSGSFNPVHIGHLALANWLCEYGGIDELWFMVSPQNPLKESAELMDAEQRLKMVAAAVEGYSRISVSDFELSMPRPTYTIDTLRALRETYPERRFQLLIGADSWNSISKWKEYRTLIREFPVIVYPRNGYSCVIPENCHTVRTVDAPLFEVSSTFIRKAIAEGKDVRFFLPEAIRESFQISKIRK